MPIGISEEHAELAASVRKWAESQGSIEAVRAAESDVSGLTSWTARAAELGLVSIALPDTSGGGGGSVLDQAVALEAAAAGLVPGPLLTTTVAGLSIDDADLRAGIAKGTISVGIGVGGSLDLVDGAFSGRVPVVFEALSATHLLLAVTGGRHVLVGVDQVAIEPGASFDLSRTCGAVSVDGLAAADVRMVVVPDLDRMHDLLHAFIAAEASGVARWC
ncbi:MAG: acyl-CoA dehydrogenase family protein, partial [Propionibacteriales bacterium]|nr:acyl-CoA dehydrogenase family protein [Propionibacteriales bacterium]